MADIGGQQTCVCLMFLFQPSSISIINSQSAFGAFLKHIF